MTTIVDLNDLTPAELERYRLARVWFCHDCGVEFTGGAYEHITQVHGVRESVTA